ncbi:hypothetical protein AV530_004781 [Patagioenas fasciata monilis]|uniref:Uncharacterized protein n=1 Tax=Patagioenas fasciata monilis TaxID=372326 RepID=A0A1V4JSM5_PATFA|nr:hypothetical protein AV530_004781 [Patagioenas fasciata monilis]
MMALAWCRWRGKEKEGSWCKTGIYSTLTGFNSCFTINKAREREKKKPKSNPTTKHWMLGSAFSSPLFSSAT